MEMDRISTILDASAFLLAQGRVRRESLGSEIVIWAGILMVVLLVIGVVWIIIRAKTREPSSGPAESMFDLGALRRMHREGQLTDEEFEKAKAVVIGAMTTKDTSPEESEKLDLQNAIAQYEAEQAVDQDLTQDPQVANEPNSGQDEDRQNDAKGDPQVQRPDNDTDADDQVTPPEKPTTESDLDQDEKNA